MRRISVLLFACFLLVPAPTQAQGFGIYEQGACVMGRGNTGVAEPCDDGSSIYVNPAGGTSRGVTLSSGAMPVFGSGTFTSDGGTKARLNNVKFPLVGSTARVSR